MSRIAAVMIVATALAFAGCGQSAQVATDEAVENATQETAQNTPPPAPRPAAPQQQAPRPRPQPVTIEAGTVLAVRLGTTLNSGTSQVGDGFTAEVIEPVEVGGRQVVPAGSTVHGTVTEVSTAKRGAGNAKLGLSFDHITLPDGRSVSIAASLSQSSESKKKRNAAIIGGSAAGGALLGRIIGKDTKGAVVGSVVGGAIGTGVVLSKEGEQVNLPAGTEMDIALDDQAQVPARS